MGPTSASVPCDSWLAQLGQMHQLRLLRHRSLGVIFSTFWIQQLMFVVAPRRIQERGWERLSSRLACEWLFWGVQLVAAHVANPAALSQPLEEVSCPKILWEKVEGYRHGRVAPTPSWPGLSSGLRVTQSMGQHRGETPASSHQPDLEGRKKILSGTATKDGGPQNPQLWQKSRKGLRYPTS